MTIEVSKQFTQVPIYKDPGLEASAVFVQVPVYKTTGEMKASSIFVQVPLFNASLTAPPVPPRRRQMIFTN